MRVFFLSCVVAGAALAQLPARPEFDAASVKPNTLDDRIVQIDAKTPARFTTRGYSLKLLIQHAWGIKGFQISGGSDWLDVDRWDIVARGSANTVEEAKLMVQALLKERFALKVHMTTKEMAGYELLVDGHPKMKTSDEKEPNENMTRNPAGALVAQGMPMSGLVKALGAYLSKPVEDSTGLKGLYDFTLFWNARFDVMPEAGAGDLNGITLPVALKDQLGLKVTAKRNVPTEVLVIDGAEKATPN